MKLCAAGMLLMLAWAAPAAGAAETTTRDRTSDVSGGAQLAKKQRAALDIERVTARANTAGLAVDVRLRGDFERLAGSGALKGAVAGIQIRRTGARSGELLTRGGDRRSEVRSERAGSGPVIVRDGRLLHFRVAGDVSTVTSVRVRVAAARQDRRGRTASDAAVAVFGSRAPAGEEPCQSYAGRRSELELLLGGVVRSLRGERTAIRRKRLVRERGGLEDFLFGLGRRILLACPILPPPSTPNGSGSLTNRMPVSSFTVSPPGPGFKAGQTLTFDGAGSRDPDGSIGAYVWSDGDPPHPIASGVRLSRWYGAPGTYKITLSVGDKLGGTAFSSKTLFVGGAGTKALRNPDNSLVRVDCPTAAATQLSGAVELTIPSYAADPAAVTPNPCPDATLATSVTRLTGNPAGELDEWGRPRDRTRIEYRFDHAGPGAGAQNNGLDWSVSWR
jgi:hypothetical protein